MKNGNLRNAQSRLYDIDSYKPFSSSNSFGSQPLARSWDPEFQEWIERNNITEDDLQYLKSAIRRRMLVWLLPCLCLPIIGAFFFVTEWSYYKIVNQRTFQPRIGILLPILNVATLLLRLVMWLTPLLIIAVLILPGSMGEGIPWEIFMWLIISFFLSLYSKQGKGTAGLSAIKKGFVGLGEDSRILRAAWEKICWPARIIRWVVLAIFSALCMISTSLPSKDLITGLIVLDLLALGICSIVNNIRYRMLLNGYASDGEPSGMEESAIPFEEKKERPVHDVIDNTYTKPKQPRKNSHGGVVAAVIAAVVLLGLAAFILPHAVAPSGGGTSRSKDKQTDKQPSGTIAQILDYTMYEGTFVPATSDMETGGPRVELQIKGSYLVYDIFYDVTDSGSKADISGATPTDGSSEIDISNSGKLYLLESGNIAVESAGDIPYIELVLLQDNLSWGNDTLEPIRDDMPTDSSEYYIWPTDTRYITYDDLSPLSRNKIMLMRNELYARYGCSFQNEEIRSYFMEQSWYTPDPDQLAVNFNVELFSEIERTNLETILGYEKAMGWRE